MACCKNVGPADRFVRALLGVAALALAITALDLAEGRIAGVGVAIVGVVLILTAVAGICPLYLPLRLSTCKVASK